MPSFGPNRPIKTATLMPSENIVRNGNSNPMLLPSATVQLLHARCPDDFNFLVDVQIRLERLVGATGAQNVDFTTNFGGNLEDKATHTATDTTSTYNITALTILHDFDISTLFGSMTAGDNVGLRITSQEGNPLYLYSLTLRYT